MRRASKLGLVGATSLAIAIGMGCGAHAPIAKPPSPPKPSEAASFLHPARWVVTDRAGATFAPPSDRERPLVREDPAIVDGARMIVEAGVVKASRPASPHLSGFAPLPDRVGGGFVFWSDERSWFSKTFLGELEPLTDGGVTGGARPWFHGFVLRTSRGLVAVDRATHKASKLAWPGVSDVYALDDKRGARVDAFGRGDVTIDGGATWIDATKRDGLLFSSLTEVKDRLEVNRVKFLDERGLLRDVPPTPASYSHPDVPTSPLLNVFASTMVAHQALGDAMVAGAELPGGRMIVSRDRGALILSTATAMTIDEGDLLGVDERFTKCQPAVVGGAVLLACAHESGAQVMSLDRAIGQPALEVTFSTHLGFVSGPRSRFGSIGRCGHLPPSASDFGVVKAPQYPSYEEDTPAVDPDAPASTDPAAVDADATDDTHYCARIDATHWIERHVDAADAEHFYRWIPGDDGTAVALVLDGAAAQDDAAPPGEGAGEPDEDESLRKPSKAGPPKPHGDKATDKKRDESKKKDDKKREGDAGVASAPSEGVRVVHVDLQDKALLGGAFPAVMEPGQAAPFRSIDADYWLEDDGSIRGWVVLPQEDATPPELEPNTRKLPVVKRPGGRRAGIRIAKDGKLTLYPPPADAVQVIAGGPFALAMTKKDDVKRWFESTDGGVTWTPIEGPPASELSPPYDNATPCGCSSLGCTWGSGMVRLGWGGPKPAEAKKEAPSPPEPARRPFKGPELKCSIDAGDPFAEAKPAPKPKPTIKAPPPPPKDKGAKDKKPVAGKDGHKEPPKVEVAPPPVTIRTTSSVALGLVKEHAFAGEFFAPFDPSEAPKKIAASDKTLNVGLGAVTPILDEKNGAVDLLFVLDKKRLRAGSGAPKLAPFETNNTRPSVFVDAAGGALVGFSSDAGLVSLVRGDASMSVASLRRTLDFEKAKTTLARAANGEIDALSYSTSSGELVMGQIDLGRAEVAPLVELPGLATLTDASEASCKAPVVARFLLDLPASIHVRAGTRNVDASSAQLLVHATKDRLCVDAIEAGLSASSTSLVARFDKPAAVVRTLAGKSTKASCSMTPPK